MNFFNEPTRFSISDYNNAIDKYTEIAKKINCVRSIYTMGSINAPGLSDIDVIVVTEDKPKQNNLKNLSTKGINDSLFIHGPVILPISFLDKLQYILYASNINSLYGNDDVPSFDEICNKKKSALSFAYLIDFIESRFMQYALVYNSKKINIRHWHARIWSVIHSIEIWQNKLGENLDPEELSLLSKIKCPRELWLNGDVIKEDCFLDAFFASELLNKIIFIKALKKLYTKLDDRVNKKKSLTIGAKKFIFDGSICTPSYYAKSLKFGGKSISAWVCNTHNLYFNHLYNYQMALKKNYNKKDWPVNDIDCYLHTLRDRANIVIKHWEWLNDYAYGSNSMSGYLGFQLNNWKQGRKIITSSLQRLLLIW